MRDEYRTTSGIRWVDDTPSIKEQFRMDEAALEQRLDREAEVKKEHPQLANPGGKVDSSHLTTDEVDTLKYHYREHHRAERMAADRELNYWEGK